MNRQICRFAYKVVFARNAGQESLIREHAALSPVLRTEVITVEDGKLLVHQTVFGKRVRKPKWID